MKKFWELLDLLKKYSVIKEEMDKLQGVLKNLRGHILTQMKINGLEEYEGVCVLKRVFPKYDKKYFLYKRKFDEEMQMQGLITYETQEILRIEGDRKNGC